MKQTIKNVFRTPKFLVGFVIMVLLLATMVIYPLVITADPLEMVGESSFMPPGTYINAQDSVNSADYLLKRDVKSNRLEEAFSVEDRVKIADFLVTYGGLSAGEIDVTDITGLLELWQSCYDPASPYKDMLNSQKVFLNNVAKKMDKALQGTDTMDIAETDEEGNISISQQISSKQYALVSEITNKCTFLLGTDNFGRDVLTELVAAAKSSVFIGLVAGLIATTIGLALGLLAGYVGGIIDDIIVFVTNLFTVIPSFVLLILISYSMSQSSRGITVVAIIIGLTSWPWTCRSVRSQVISLRSREHVNLMKLSGYRMSSIILRGVLPYIASYVVMALILQIAQGILAEAQLSMLGLGASTTKSATLGLMMTWATTFSAHVNGSWWAYFPVILLIAFVTFSMNLMNTGLDQVFNPQLRE